LIRYAETGDEDSPNEELSFPWNQGSVAACYLWLGAFVVTAISLALIASRLLARWTADDEQAVNTHFLAFLPVLLPITTILIAVIVSRKRGRNEAPKKDRRD